MASRQELAIKKHCGKTPTRAGMPRFLQRVAGDKVNIIRQMPVPTASITSAL